MAVRGLLFVAILGLSAMAGAQTPALSGDYSGVLGPLHLKLHLTRSSDGSLTGSLDSIDQGAKGLPCADLRQDQDKFSFTVPSVGGKWNGTVSSNGATLTGTWSQGADMPLAFTRDQTFTAAEKPSRVDGVWLGTLEAGPAKLRIQANVRSDRKGQEFCSIDSLDQDAFDLPCSNVKLDGNNFSFEVPSVHGSWHGTLNDKSDRLDGTWSQRNSLPLRFARQASAIPPPKQEPPKFDEARAPVRSSEWKSVLDTDLAAVISNGALATGKEAALVIGILQEGKPQVFAYGSAHADSIFEIGSVTKTFTGLLLAQMVSQGKVKLDQPVRELLPAGTVPKPDGPEITLLDLATQHSGLPRMPDNFKPGNPADPYVDYHTSEMYAFLRKHGVGRPANADFLYSNFGFGLLGVALANCAHTSYADLLHTQITGPLQMTDTAIQLSPQQQARFVTGHDAQHHTAHAWNLDAFAGAGGIRSTASDLLRYVNAQTNPDVASGSATLAAALRLSHELRADAPPHERIALAWFFDPDAGIYWHNGATGGYSSYVFFNPGMRYAGVVLYNETINPRGSFADKVGQHIRQRFAGKPAVSLSSP